MNLPEDFPRHTPCWFCMRNIQSHSGCWQNKPDINKYGVNIATVSNIKISCFRHLPENTLTYRWIKKNNEWLFNSLIISHDNFIVLTEMDKGLYSGTGSIYLRASNDDINKILEIPDYWIFKYSLSQINFKLKTYNTLL